jgi:hypothetical protein
MSSPSPLHATHQIWPERGLEVVAQALSSGALPIQRPRQERTIKRDLDHARQLQRGLRDNWFSGRHKLNSRLVYGKNEMSPRRRKAEDVDVFTALVRVMLTICGEVASDRKLRLSEMCIHISDKKLS